MSERPTMAPPFDPTAFARESEARLRVASKVEPDVADDESGIHRSAPPTPRVDGSGPLLGTGTLASVPTLAVSFGDLRTLPLDHRAGFVLSLVDGFSNIETILDMCGMDRDDALKIVADLTERGILRLA